MTRRITTELPLRGLLALEFMADSGTMIIQSSAGGNSSYSFQKEATKEEPHGSIPDGAPLLDHAIYNALYQRGLITHANKAVIDKEFGFNPRLAHTAKGPNPDQKEPITPFAWYDHPYLVNDLGRQTLERERPRLADYRAEQAAKADEFIVAKRSSKKGGAGAFCKVERRTDKRVYVTLVERSGGHDYDHVIQGGAIKYLAVEDVLADDVDRSTWKRMSDATDEREAALKRAEEEIRAKVAPLYAEHESRKKQIEAQFEDELADIARAPDAPRPR